MTLLQRTKKLLSVLLLSTMVCSFAGCAKTVQEEEKSDNGGGLKLTYDSSSVTVMDDADALQKAVDEMAEKAKKNVVALSYKSGATSTNGTDFTCYLANSTNNDYDMVIGVYSDIEMNDELCLTGLIRPGEAFQSLTLNRALEVGTHELYVYFTLMEEDLQTVHAQTAISMLFTVTEE